MAEDLNFHKKRKRVTCSSLTKLSTKVTELEANRSSPDALYNAQNVTSKLKTLDAEFRDHQLKIMDLTTTEEALTEEQQALDDHEDIISELSIRVQRLIAFVTPSASSDALKLSTKRLTLLQGKLKEIDTAVKGMDDDEDNICALEEYRDQIAGLKSELSEIKTAILGSDAGTDDPVMNAQAEVDKLAFECLLAIKKRLRSSVVGRPAASSETSATKLPKLEVPVFHGDILQWKSYWEQFSVSVHDRLNLTKAENLVYLQNSIKDKTAKGLIEGLTRSSEHYDEAVKCLLSRYDRPRVIHQAHVRRIVDAPPLKEGTGKEIRQLHDLVVQHLRALKALGHEPSKPFITSLLEMKLDSTTMFEWQRHSQEHSDVPDYQILLDFLNLRAQAAEASSDKKRPTREPSKPTRQVTSLVSNATPTDSNCLSCKNERHPLYSCSKFRSLPHTDKVDLLKSNNHCLNCLRPGHFVKKCKSLNRCKHCQRPHHTLLHKDVRDESSTTPVPNASPISPQSNSTVVPANHASISSNMLLMTCRVAVETPQGTVNARALLDTGSSASFVSERLAQSLRLYRHTQNARICGIAGLPHSDGKQSIARFTILSTVSPSKKFNVNAIIVPQVTCDLPVLPITPNQDWKHLENIQLADPDYAKPGKVDILLGVETFVKAIRHGRRSGPHNSPTALETEFGWVLAGGTGGNTQSKTVASHHVSVLTGDDILRQFWEVEEKTVAHSTLTLEERSVLDHFQSTHSRTPEGRFVVPLPKRPTTVKLGESRAQAVRRFLSFEKSLHARRQFHEVEEVMEEYFINRHAEEVPLTDLEKPPEEVFYLPIHIVRKETSTTTKVRAVFDASAKTSTGISLNDILLVGPTVHPPLLDVLIRFRSHRVALVADISRMYRAVQLSESDKDLHRFVWRKDPKSPLKDFRMTRITFGVSSSSFIANMCIKQNALDLAAEYPNAAEEVGKSFYVDDCLTGSDSSERAVALQKELQELLGRGGFLLRKWNSSEPAVMASIASELKDAQSTLPISSPDNYTKTLGLEWNSTSDQFRLTVSELPPTEGLTKRLLVSDVAKTFDVLGWYSPTIIKAKILLQMLWSEKIGWDDPVPEAIIEQWSQWRKQLPLLSNHCIPRCYFPKDTTVVSVQLHGFSDASEKAYSGVVYLRMEDSSGTVHTSLVMSKTRVAPIKRQTIPRLELCGALILAQLLSHCKDVLKIPMQSIFAWTDSTIMLSWLQGNPRRFKVYVGNRVAQIMDLTSPDCWNHVVSSENPADCASRGIFPSEILEHHLWWNGPTWLKLPRSYWPKQFVAPPDPISEEMCTVSCNTVVTTDPLIPFDRFERLHQYKRVIAWVIRFIDNCRARKQRQRRDNGPITTKELNRAEIYWFSIMQRSHFYDEIEYVKRNKEAKNGKISISSSNIISTLNPILDDDGLLRIGGRQQNAKFTYNSRHPILLHSKHPLTKLMIRSEHLRLLHGGPLLVSASLFRNFHIVGGNQAIRSITRSCVTCRHRSAKPKPQLMGQLPSERITPDTVFSQVGVDYAGPVYLKQGSIRKPNTVKAYICVFVSLSVKAVHLEPVSDLTTESFLACLRRFVARRGKPTLMWSDHGTNFVGANRILKELLEFLHSQKTNEVISDFCSSQGITWQFIPERAPHFGGLWEAAVKSLKTHMSRVVGNAKLNFEELTTVLSQIEACLNSRPLGTMPHNDDDGIEVLTPGHFIIGRPMQALTDHALSYKPMPVLRRWYLCEALVRHFWNRWSSEYVTSLRKYSKWKRPSKNLRKGDVVALREDGMVPTQWPIARIVETHQGKDGLVRVVTLKTKNGVYTRPATKVALLLSCEEHD